MELWTTPGKEQMEMEEHLYFLHQIYYFFYNRSWILY